MNNSSLKNKIERFVRQHAIPNLSLYVVLCYGFGYLLEFVNSSFIGYLTLNPYAILHGQVWRLFTWVLVPPSSSNIFYVLIAMLFYYSIGTSLERTWGTYNYNVYIFSGLGMTIIGAFVVMAISYLLYGEALLAGYAPSWFAYIAQYFSTYYITMSIFLAYAATFPNAIVLFMFILPVKVKWLGIIYGVILAFEFVQYALGGGWFVCVAMVASLANFGIFIWRSKKLNRFNPAEMKRRSDWKRATQSARKSAFGGGNKVGGRYSGTGANPQSGYGRPSGAGTAQGMRPRQDARHQCAICGRTDADDPTLEFRFCSKCAGSWEFCQDHLFHHVHAMNGSSPAQADEVNHV